MSVCRCYCWCCYCCCCWYVFRISANRFQSYSNKYTIETVSRWFTIFSFWNWLMALSHVNDHTISWLVDWLDSARMVGWLVGWLAHWLAGCFIFVSPFNGLSANSHKIYKDTHTHAHTAIAWNKAIFMPSEFGFFLTEFIEFQLFCIRKKWMVHELLTVCTNRNNHHHHHHRQFSIT